MLITPVSLYHHSDFREKFYVTDEIYVKNACFVLLKLHTKQESMVMLPWCWLFHQKLLNSNNIYLLQLGCHLVAVVILHVYRT